MKNSPRALLVAAAAVAVLAVAALLVATLGGKTSAPGTTADKSAGGTGEKTAGDKPVPAKPSSIEKIASTIGCKADITVDAKELRQAACESRRTRYRMVTFATDTGQHAWLEEAQAYGGTYLVGKRWAITAQPTATLDGLRHKLGGTIEAGASHGSDQSHQHSG
ncbi:hypothetical protein [Wenjunlia tyrosinilytica]|uniref:Lipoprotein n=1 Tax=Wenjunlia tyrosinilytica TaxID=1544741 RepID=A0A918DY17_9ACTN|nr:hypothetical protein [Wenjunlia tyrosinilytica]GGO87442.1 hypothetical protein GCM10012280_25900 [Wenjunlia tyrosinilytica]